MTVLEALHVCTCGETNSSVKSKSSIFLLHFQKYQTSEMSSPDDQHWVMSGQDIIFEKIMMMVGLTCLDCLYKCEQVCTTWKAMIRRTIWESPSKRNIFKMRIEKHLDDGKIYFEDTIHANWLGTITITSKVPDY